MPEFSHARAMQIATVMRLSGNRTAADLIEWQAGEIERLTELVKNNSENS